MRVSSKTLKIMENFAQINNSVYLDERGYLKNVSAAKNVIGLAKIEEDFGVKVAIYNLSEFCGIVRMFNLDAEVDFEFTEDTVVITQGNTSVTYFLSNPDHIYNRTKAYASYFSDDQFKGSFKLDDTTFQSLLKASKIMGLKTVNIQVKKDKGTISLLDPSNSAANKYKLELEGSGTCACKLLTDNLNFIRGDYDVFVFERYVKFICGDLCYIILNKAGE